MYLVSLILLKLSSHRSFAVSLNTKCPNRNISSIDFQEGCYSDLLILVIHKILVSGSESFFPLYGSFLTVICNISPYIRSMTATSAIKLVNLFHLFCSPRFLFNAQSNHLLLSLLIEAFNNVLQYQYTGNTSLVYAIICRKEDFYELEYMTLSIAIQVISRALVGLLIPNVHRASRMQPLEEDHQRSHHNLKAIGNQLPGQLKMIQKLRM